MMPALPRPTGGGFTLLELVVVLVIVGLMVALVVPRLTGPMANLDLKTAAKKVSASLRYARSRAATEKAVYVALFDFDHNRLTVIDTPLTMNDFLVRKRAEIEQALISRLGREQDGPDRGKTFQPPDGVRFEKGNAANRTVASGFLPVFFFPTGASSGGTIVLANRRDRRYDIMIDFITGMVRLSEVTGS